MKVMFDFKNFEEKCRRTKLDEKIKKTFFLNNENKFKDSKLFSYDVLNSFYLF